MAGLFRTRVLEGVDGIGEVGSGVGLGRLLSVLSISSKLVDKESVLSGLRDRSSVLSGLGVSLDLQIQLQFGEGVNYNLCLLFQSQKLLENTT